MRLLRLLALSLGVLVCAAGVALGAGPVRPTPGDGVPGPKAALRLTVNRAVVVMHASGFAPRERLCFWDVTRGEDSKARLLGCTRTSSTGRAMLKRRKRSSHGRLEMVAKAADGTDQFASVTVDLATGKVIPPPVDPTTIVAGAKLPELGRRVSAQTYDFALPADATVSGETNDRGTNRVTFTVGAIQGAVAVGPGDCASLDDQAAVLGPPAGHKTLTLAGSGAYGWVNVSYGAFSVTVLGCTTAHQITIQLVGHKADTATAKQLAVAIAHSIRVLS